MDNLANASAKVALSSLDALDAMVKFPRHLSVQPEGLDIILDKRLCLSLLKNPKVMVPLLQFCIRNAADNPSTDIERIIIARGIPVFQMLRTAGPKPMQIAINPLWSGYE